MYIRGAHLIYESRVVDSENQPWDVPDEQETAAEVRSPGDASAMMKRRAF